MDPAFNSWSNKGHSLLNFYATTHPSQPNYISMGIFPFPLLPSVLPPILSLLQSPIQPSPDSSPLVLPTHSPSVAGDTLGVTSNDPYNLNASHIGDLLEAKGFTWCAPSAFDSALSSRLTPSGSLTRRTTPATATSPPSLASMHASTTPSPPSSTFRRTPIVAVASWCLLLSSTLTSLRAPLFLSVAFPLFLILTLDSGNLPTYSFYTPNLDNDGHEYAFYFASPSLVLV